MVAARRVSNDKIRDIFNDKKWYTTNEIMALTGRNYSSVANTIAKMVLAGNLKKDRFGKRRITFYALTTAGPLFEGKLSDLSEEIHNDFIKRTTVQAFKRKSKAKSKAKTPELTRVIPSQDKPEVETLAGLTAGAAKFLASAEKVIDENALMKASLIQAHKLLGDVIANLG